MVQAIEVGPGDGGAGANPSGGTQPPDAAPIHKDSLRVRPGQEAGLMHNKF